MPTLDDLKNDIIAINSNADKKGHFNSNCESKIHTTEAGTMTKQEVSFVNGVIDDVEDLDATDFATLQGMLPDGAKLSGWPC